MRRSRKKHFNLGKIESLGNRLEAVGILLNPTHERVAQELASGKSPVEASRLAGYPDGLSFEANARKRASRPDIKARVLQLQKRAAVLAEVDKGYILAKLKDLAEFNLADYLVRGKDGEFYLDINECSREQLGRLVELQQEVAFDGDGKGKKSLSGVRKTKLKGYDVISALSQMARIVGVEKDPTADAIGAIGQSLNAAFERARLATK